MQKKTFVGLVSAALAATAGAYTVYDGGKALRQNCASGAYTGANGETYVDENGGKWQYLRAQDTQATSTIAFGAHNTDSTGTYDGIGGSTSPYIRVNITGAATMTSVNLGTPVDADEFYIHPGTHTAANRYVVLRFIVPEDGWYSAFLTAHDLDGAGDQNTGAGADVRLLANNIQQAIGIVTREKYVGTGASTLLMERFDFQMPVRWMAAGETLDFMVGPNGNYNNDATGLKAFVTKEDEGRFYDAGLAMTNNIFGSRLNPFGTTALGMWYWCYADTSAPRSSSGASESAPADAFAAWAPGQLSKKLTRFTENCTRTNAPLIKGFATTTVGNSPYICVNHTTTSTNHVAPGELYTHPTANNWSQWPTLRFRPSRGGLYSASVVVRDVSRNVSAAASDGVVAYLLVAENVVTSEVVCAEQFNATVHFTFDARLVAANEPIDILISPHNGHPNDATTISAIFRREADAYDAGYSMAALDWANASFPNSPAHPFADALGGGVTWDIDRSESVQGTFTTMPYAFKKVVDNVDYFGYGAASDGGLPRVMVSTNGVAQVYNATDNVYYRMAPNELWAHPNNSGKTCPRIRATVQADGIYHGRAYARSIAYSKNGIRFGLAIGSGQIPASACVSLSDAAMPYEAAVNGDRLWLKSGETLGAVLDPINGNHTSDGTGAGVCYVKDGDPGDGTRVVNVHFTERGTGKFSPTAQRPREGWSDWDKWNAIRSGDMASAECRNCMEADGTTERNMTVTLTHDSGTAIEKGSSSDAVFFSYVSSSGTSDTYTFTITNLKKNEPYTLYLYSVKSSSGEGNALFTVGGVTKGVEETWILGDGQKVLTRFDVTSDANGVISGTFAAKDANGGAFNGLTLVGDLPPYVATGTLLVVR